MAVSSEILEALTRGIQSEIATYVFYVEAVKKVDNEDLKNTLEGLAGEEKRHFQILERQYDSLVRSEKWISAADILKQEGLPEINEDMTDRHRDLIAEVRSFETMRQVLTMALTLEEEARVLFTRLAAEAPSDEARKTFENLAGFEESHVELIRTMINSLTDTA